MFAHDPAFATDELAALRYEASVRPGFQESFAAMFPAPRQRWVDALATPDDVIAALPHRALVVHGRDRPEALARLKRALSELIVDGQGVETTIPLFHALLAEEDIQKGDYSIHWLEKWLARTYG